MVVGLCLKHIKTGSKSRTLPCPSSVNNGDAFAPLCIPAHTPTDERFCMRLTLDERFSLLMCTTVFTFFHHSMWIPVGLSALFFLDKNTGLLFICTISIWHLLQRDGSAGLDYQDYWWIGRRPGFVARLIIANSPFTHITADRQACGLCLHYKCLSLPPLFWNTVHEKNPPSNFLQSLTLLYQSEG